MVGTIIYLMLIFSVFVGATTHRRSEDCVDASQALKAFLDKHDEWFEYLYFDDQTTFEYVYEGFTGTTLDEFPNDFFCAFTGLTSVDDLLVVLYQTGQILPLFKVLYNYGCATCIVRHGYIQYMLDDPRPYDNVTELHIHDQLLVDLIASGIVTMDPEGFLWLYSIFRPTDGYPDFYPTGDYLSTEPLSDQVARIANDIRKVWNTIVPHMGPGGGQDLRDEVKRWTGIPLGPGAEAHDMALIVVRTILATVEADDPVTELLRVLYYHDVIGHAMRAGYQELDWIIAEYEEYVQNIDGSNHGPPQETMELTIQVIQALRNMGLMNLSVN